MKLETPLPTPHARYYRYFYTYVLGMPWSTVWSQVTKYLSKILNKVVPCCPVLCLSNDNSQFPMSIHDKRIWISDHAAKEMLVVRWKPPHTLSLDHWWHLLLDILTLELLVAQSHGATDKTLKSWSEAIAETKKKKKQCSKVWEIHLTNKIINIIFYTMLIRKLSWILLSVAAILKMATMAAMLKIHNGPTFCAKAVWKQPKPYNTNIIVWMIIMYEGHKCNTSHALWLHVIRLGCFF